MSWADGYQCYSTSDIDQIANSSSPEHPLLVLLAHDGDNAFGGGYTYYKQCVSSFVKEAEAKVCSEIDCLGDNSTTACVGVLALFVKYIHVYVHVCELVL